MYAYKSQYLSVYLQILLQQTSTHPENPQPVTFTCVCECVGQYNL